MATLTITIAAASGSSSKTLTYSGADALRIFNAWKALWGKSSSTQDDLVGFLAKGITNQFVVWVERSETVTTKPLPPVIT